MEGMLKIPYTYLDPNCDFDYKRDISSKEYVTALVNNYKKYSPIISRNVANYDNFIYLNHNNGVIREKSNVRKADSDFFDSTMVIIRDMNNTIIPIDPLIRYYQTGEMCILNLQLPTYNQNDVLESEIRSWLSETARINRYEGLTDEERLRGYTPRDLRIEFKGNKSVAVLKNTKLIDIVNNHTFAFLIDRIFFIK